MYQQFHSEFLVRERQRKLLHMAKRERLTSLIKREKRSIPWVYRIGLYLLQWRRRLNRPGASSNRPLFTSHR